MKDEKRMYHVCLTVEVDVRADGPTDAAGQAEERAQALFDKHAKRMNAVVGADYSNVEEKGVEA